MEGIARTRRKGILSTLWSLEIWMRFIPVIDLLYRITRSVDLHIDDFSFRNTDAQFHPIDRKAIRAVASQPNVKTLAAFSQNICKSFASRPAAASREWRALRIAFWAHFCFHSDERHFDLVENEFNIRSIQPRVKSFARNSARPNLLSLRLRLFDRWTAAATIFTEAGGTWHCNDAGNIEHSESHIGLFSQAAAAS